MSTRKTAAAPLLGCVLHSWDWSETSLIVDLFTRDRGRLVVIAKGAKRPTSQLRAVLLPFQPLLATLGRGSGDEQGEVQLLRSAERAAGPAMPPGTALLAGFHLNELLLKLLARQDPHPRLFDAYVQTLEALHEAAESIEPALRAFELTLLRELGVLPELNQVTLTLQPLASDRRYGLHGEAGVVDAASGVPGAPGAAWTAIEQALAQHNRGALLAAVTPVAAALRGPLRQVLHYHLGGNPMRTRALGLELQKLGTALGTPHDSHRP